MCENCITSLKKVIPSFPATLSKSWGPTKPPLFENLVGSSTPQAEREGVHSMCKLLTLTANRNKKSWGSAKPPSFWKLGWKFNLPPSRKGGVHTMCKPLTLTANRNKKSVRCHNESWQHNFFNPRFSGMGSKLIKKKCPFMEKSWTHYI